jgi:hypothetical protein
MDRMHVRGPIWHVLISLSLLGCYDMHGYERDAGSPLGRDATVIGLDAPLDVSPVIEPRPDAGVDYCAQAIAAIRGGADPESIGCDGRTFPRVCETEVGECCWLSLSCAIEPGDGGHLESSLGCYDVCDQSCAAQTADDCALFPYCEWFEPFACGPGPAGTIEGPVCVNHREGPCETDGDCAEGRRCQTYWINPCLGASCDACGGEERRCAY